MKPKFSPARKPTYPSVFPADFAILTAHPVSGNPLPNPQAHRLTAHADSCDASRMKYQTATTEQRAGVVNPDGTLPAPKPPDDSGAWQLIGLHTFMRGSSPLGADPFGIVGSVVEWFVHFYWQRAMPEEPKPKPAPTLVPGKGRLCPLP